jgi:hypothetical protein
MRYRDPTRETAGDARRDLLDAAVVLGAHVDAPEGDVDDEIIVRALPAFMDARERYLASLGARYGITLDSGPRPTHAHHSVLDVARRFGLTAWARPRAHRATACLRPADALPPAGTSSRPGRGRPCYRPTARERCRLGIQMTSPGRRVGHSAKRSRSPAPDFLGQGAAGRRWNNGAGRPATVLSPRAHGRRTRGARFAPPPGPAPSGNPPGS